MAWSLSRVSVTVQGRPLANLRGTSKPEVVDAVPTRIMAGGKKGVDWNEYPDANTMDYTFTVAAPSGDEHFLDSLVGRGTVDLIVAYTDDSDFPDGAFTGLVGRGKLSRAPRQDGDEIGENAYTVHLNGFTMTYKNKPSITRQ